MGNLIESFASGLGKAIGSIFHAPVDFLAGKSCSSVCGPTWDLTCYIENFCIANLLKLALILVVVYMVILFIYLTYKLRVFHCLFCCIFKMAWTCCSTCLCTCTQCCHCLLHELSSVRRRPRRRAHIRHVENFGASNPATFDNNNKNFSLHGRNRNRTRRHRGRGHLIRSSLRPRSHRVRVGIRQENEHGGGKHFLAKKGYAKNRRRSMGHSDVHRGVRVMRTSRFAHKGSGFTSSRRQK